MTDTPAVPPLMIGQSLREKRLQKNLTTEQAAQDTKIHIKFIRALEEEKWAEFPARVYLEGFLKRYAGYLGLEDAPLVRQLRQSAQEGEKPQFSSPAPREEGEDERLAPAVGRSLWFLAGGGVLVLSLALAYVKLEERRLALEKPLTPETLLLPPAPVQPPPPVSREARVSAKAPIWVRVWVDDNVRFEGILSIDKPKSWILEKKLRVMAGDPQLVTVSVDGVPVAARPGDPAGEIRWAPEEPAPAPALESPAPAAPAPPPAPPAPVVKKPAAPVRRPIAPAVLPSTASIRQPLAPASSTTSLDQDP